MEKLSTIDNGSQNWELENKKRETQLELENSIEKLIKLCKTLNFIHNIAQSTIDRSLKEDGIRDSLLESLKEVFELIPGLEEKLKELQEQILKPYMNDDIIQNEIDEEKDLQTKLKKTKTILIKLHYDLNFIKYPGKSTISEVIKEKPYRQLLLNQIKNALIQISKLKEELEQQITTIKKGKNK